MPARLKGLRSASRSQSSARGQSDVRARFDELVPLLGKAGLAELRRHPVIVSSLGDGVVVHAAVRQKRPLTLARIAKEKPIVGVIANSIPLREPNSLAVLKPGAYVVRVRRAGKTAVAFDYFAERSAPALSGHARPLQPIPTDAALTIGSGNWKADVDITLPWDPDSFDPPDGSEGKFCLSLFAWSHCWDWDWPKLPKWLWPF
jgi:hypothetical protein